jgi:hypothetical protein
MGDVLTFNGVSLGWEVQWGLVDWSIPAGVFNHQGSYIGALNKIAASAGGYVQPHASSQIIRVLPRYPTVPWEWDTVTPDFQLPADVTSRESLRWIEKPAYNRVFVSGQEVGVLGQVTRSGTAGEILAPMVVDALVTNATAARQRGIAVLADTGRQIEVSLRLPVLPETGIIVPGAFVDYQDGSVSRRGLVRSTQVEAGLPEVWQTWECRPMHNLYQQFRALLPDPPLQVGTVIAVSGGVVTVQMPGGGLLKARGDAFVGQKVFVRDAVVEAIAPNLTLEIIDI